MTKKNNNASDTQDTNPKEHCKYTRYINEHMQTGVEYGKNLFSTIQAASSETSKKITDIYAENLALGKSFLTCTNFEDVINWGEKTAKTNLDNCLHSLHSIYNQTCTEINKANSEVAKKASQNFAKIKRKFED